MIHTDWLSRWYWPSNNPFRTWWTDWREWRRLKRMGRNVPWYTP